jgi:corrinoid protein of di/trimethylamine methyltransferase
MTADNDLMERIRQSIIEGDDHASVQAAADALAADLDPQDILNDGLMAGADIMGKRFQAGEFFLPELMLAGRALKAAMSVIEPVLQAKYGGHQDTGDTGVVVMATVQTDIHDIGKNIVGSMLVASGFKVTDLGVNVPIEDVIAKAHEINANIIGLSALLTTSMPFMKALIKLLDQSGDRQKFKVMVGGASVTSEWAKDIGSDGTAPNAIQAVALAKKLIREQREERQAAG